jgi:AraC-like DNA-binding protein
MPSESKIPYLKWKERLNAVNVQRIDDDLLLIDHVDYKKISTEPVRSGMVTAIIYLQGKAKLSINMKEYAIEAPCMVVILPDSIFYPIEVSDNIIYKVVVMSPTFANGLFSNIDEMHQLKQSVLKNPMFTIKEDLPIFQQYLDMLSSLIIQSKSPHKLKAALHLTLTMFYGYSYAKHDVSNTKSSNRSTTIYNRFMSLLQKNYLSQREVAYYANILCITPKHLSLVIKEVSGQTPLSIIHQYVVTESKALLYSTDLTIQEISERLNFPSQSDFGKFFKKLTGLSPNQYRGKI